MKAVILLLLGALSLSVFGEEKKDEQPKPAEESKYKYAVCLANIAGNRGFESYIALFRYNADKDLLGIDLIYMPDAKLKDGVFTYKGKGAITLNRTAKHSQIEAKLTKIPGAEDKSSNLKISITGYKTAEAILTPVDSKGVVKIANDITPRDCGEINLKME